MMHQIRDVSVIMLPIGFHPTAILHWPFLLIVRAVDGREARIPTNSNSIKPLHIHPDAFRQILNYFDKLKLIKLILNDSNAFLTNHN